MPLSSRCGDFPDNAILSHDLLEGAYAVRLCSATSILYEELSLALCRRRAPAASLDPRRLADCRVAVAVGARAVGPAHAQSDLGAVALEDFRQPAPQPGAGGHAAAAACLLVVAPPLSRWPATRLRGRRRLPPRCLPRLADLLRKPVDLPLGMHLRVTLQSLGRPLMQSALTHSFFLPYEAYISVDAIVRTLVRMVLDANGSCWSGRPPAIRSAAPAAVLPASSAFDGDCAGVAAAARLGTGAVTIARRCGWRRAVDRLCGSLRR